MNIENNILKYYLRNVLFINGTAYAGKSTMCAMLAARYGLVHCAENYHFAMPQQALSRERQPNLCYFQTMKDWQEFVNRAPGVYDAWIQGGAREASEIEIAELIRLSNKGRIIADTNIAPDLLAEIADYNQIAFMLSPQEMAVERFFERSDPDKVFVRAQIMKAEDPEKTMENYRACIARINSKERYDEFAKSGFFTLVRKDDGRDTRHEAMALLADHFGLSNKKDILIATEHLWIRPAQGNDAELPERLEIFDKSTDALIGWTQLIHKDAAGIPESECRLLDDCNHADYAIEAEIGVRRWARSYFQNAGKGN